MNLHSALLDPDTRGEQPLWRVFWLEGVLLSHVLFGIVVLSYRQVGSGLLAALLLGFLLYTGWIMRRVWINAGNVGNTTYGEIARFLTVAWTLNALLVAGFMLMAHLSGEAFPLPF